MSLCKAIRPLARSAIGHPSECIYRGLATTVSVPPVSQNATSSKGPTAMVFMNMGGPSTTGEVGDFLSRLFVGSQELDLENGANLS